MSYLVSLAVLALLVPVAVVLVGMANLRRHTGRKGEMSEVSLPRPGETTRKRANFPLPKPPALGERAVVSAHLSRPFSLKTQLTGAAPYEAKSRA